MKEITPLLEKGSLSKDALSSYRPISNLNFLSKVLERIINNRLLSHLNSFPSFSPFQSAYRKYHSVETALLKIQNDLLLAIDKKKVSALVLLDLSAAFDTVTTRFFSLGCLLTLALETLHLNFYHPTWLTEHNQLLSIRRFLLLRCLFLGFHKAPFLVLYCSHYAQLLSLLTFRIQNCYFTCMLMIPSCTFPSQQITQLVF